MANTYEVKRDNEALGSFTSSQLREMAKNGTLLKEDLIRKIGKNAKWTRAANVKSFVFLETETNLPDFTSTISEEIEVEATDVSFANIGSKETPTYTHPPDSKQTNLLRNELPVKIRELIHVNEEIVYASRPSKNALIIGMVLNGLVYGIISLGILLPFALLFTYLSWKNTYYVITNSRTIVVKGIFNVATKIILNENIQLISINTGIIDRWLKLNSVELSTAAQGGGTAGIFGFFPGMSKGCVTLKHVEVTDVVTNYAQI